MKKRNLKTLNINKEKVSSFEVMDNIKGGSWIFCTGTCPTCRRCAQTNEGPCPGGTSGCVVSGGCHIP